MKIGKAVDTLLIEREMSRKELGIQLGKSKGFVGNVCQQTNVNTKTIEAICKVLEVKPSRFVEIAQGDK